MIIPNMKTKLLLGCCIVFIFQSCMVGKENSQISNIEWLVGTWENKTTQGSMYETWKKVSRNELSGKSYILRDKDTVVLENVQLIKKKKILTYVPTVQGQNNNQPVSFPLKSRSEDKVVVENKSHDFPQIISYTRVSKDSLAAEISGISKEVTKIQVIPMRRVR
jgi:hypothetical protein